MTEFDPVIATQIQWTTIPPGPQGTKETLGVMAALIREGARSGRFQDFVRRIFGDDPGTLNLDHFHLDRWIRGHFRYRPELYEVLRTVDYMLDDLQQKGWIEGDCDDISIFYAALLLVLGVRCKLVAIRYSDPVNFQHVYVEFLFNQEWVSADPTVDPGTNYHELERLEQSL